MKAEPEEAVDWSLTTFEGAERDRIRRTSQWSFREKLEWNESMLRFAQSLKPAKPPTSLSDPGK